MNEKDKKAFYIATCQCCMLAEAMKNCAACQFNIGLVEKPERIAFEPNSLPIPAALFPISEQQLDRV